MYCFIDSTIPPTGLPNTGNSCYANSLIQCLRNLPAVQTTSVKSLLKSDASIFLSQILGSNLPAYKINPGSQEDALELFNLLCEKHPDLHKQFAVGFQQRLNCTCGHLSSSSLPWENYVNASRKEKNSMESFLQSSLETIKDFKCDECKKTGTTIKRLSLAKISSCLVLACANMQKIPCSFPEYLHFQNSSGKTLVYKLVAGMQYYGGGNSGHWTAAVLKKSWYGISDSSVCSLSGLPSSYTVFYHLLKAE